MAWNPSPKVADCRDIARKWKKHQVIILAIDINANTLEYSSYGETKELCAQAKRLADRAFDAVCCGVSMESLINGPSTPPGTVGFFGESNPATSKNVV